MNKNEFLDTLKTFTEKAVSELILPCRVQGKGEEQSCRAAEVHKMRLPDSKAATKKAPYIIHQIITSEDVQQEGKKTEAHVQLRSIFCVYCDDEEEGSLMLLELMERVRIALLRTRLLDNRFLLDITASPMQMLIYPDDTAPYFAGEMLTVWRLPAVEREVREWLQ